MKDRATARTKDGGKAQIRSGRRRRPVHTCYYPSRVEDADTFSSLLLKALRMQDAGRRTQDVGRRTNNKMKEFYQPK